MSEAYKALMEKYTGKSLVDLVIAHNHMAESTIGKELKARPVQNFKSVEDGAARCATLESSILARASGFQEAKQSEGDTTVAKKVKKAKKAKTAKKANGASENLSANPVAAAFGARKGTNREKLLIKLADNKGKRVKRNDLLKAVYGSMNEENLGSLAMVLKGAQGTIVKNKLKFDIKKEKDEKTKEITFALHAK